MDARSDVRYIFTSVNSDGLSIKCSQDIGVADRTNTVLDLNELQVHSKQIKVETIAEVKNEYCAIPSCNNSKLLCPNKAFFEFPHQEDRCRQWIAICKLKDINGRSGAGCEERYMICEDHFILDFFCNKSRKALKQEAIPTLLLHSRNELIETNSNFKHEDNLVEDEQDDHDIKAELLKEVVGEILGEFSEGEGAWEPPGLMCRLCANKVEDVIYIFSSTGEELEISNKINASLPISVKKTDPLPKQVCATCIVKLNTCHNFTDQCIQAEKKLMTFVRRKQFRCNTYGTSNALVARDSSNTEDADNAKSDSNSSQTLVNHNSFVGLKVKAEEDMKTPFVKASKCLNCPLCCSGQMVMDKQLDGEVHEEVGPSDLLEECVLDASVVQGESSVGMDGSVVYQDEAGNRFTVIDTGGDWWGEDDSLLAPEVKVKVEEVMWTCRLCNEELMSLDSCLDHATCHSSDSSHPCVLCDSTFLTRGDLDTHHLCHTRPKPKVSRRLHCNACGRRFNSEKTRSEHNCVAAGTKHFRCKMCNKSYSSLERVRFHQRFHSGAQPNHCEHCDKDFDNEGSLYYHTRLVHDGERRFCCDECGKKFYSHSRLAAHKRVHSGERPFECQDCGRRFYDRETLKGHCITHMTVKPFQCDLCGVCCGRKSLLNHHMQVHHSGSYVPKRVPSLIHYNCRICDRTFTNSSEVVTHRSMHWGTKRAQEGGQQQPHACEYCGLHFAFINALAKHRKEEHPLERPYECALCGETSHTLYEARLHRKLHTEEQSNPTSEVIICEECGMTFGSKRQFRTHIKGHRNTSHPCQVCGKQFADRRRLAIHTRLHTGEKPYQCGDCGKSFTQSSALYIHRLLHTGEKPHGCDLCGRTFRIKADRDNHKRIHTGEKPFKCEYCFKEFRTGQVYYQHRMIHTGERRYPCDVCGKAFKRSHTLVVHKRIHTGEKPNICDVCGRGFRQRTDMRKHRALHGAQEFTT